MANGTRAWRPKQFSYSSFRGSEFSLSVVSARMLFALVGNIAQYVKTPREWVHDVLLH